MVMDMKKTVAEKAGSDRFADIFCSFGEKSKEIDALGAKGTDKKIVRKLVNEMNKAQRELSKLQNRRLNFMIDLSGNGGVTVSKDELDEASLRYALAKKLVEKVEIASGNVRLLLD
jgi:hypothetical protein